MISIWKKQKICLKCNDLILQRMNIYIYYCIIILYCIIIISYIFASSSSSFTVRKLDHHTISFHLLVFQQTFARSSRKSQKSPGAAECLLDPKVSLPELEGCEGPPKDPAVIPTWSSVIYNATFWSGSCFTCFWSFWKDDSMFGRVYIPNKATELTKKGHGQCSCWCNLTCVPLFLRGCQ